VVKAIPEIRMLTCRYNNLKPPWHTEKAMDKERYIETCHKEMCEVKECISMME